MSTNESRKAYGICFGIYFGMYFLRIVAILSERFNFLKYREGYTDIEKMAFNPQVTVRSRGVMEKCTYCVQRINQTRITAQKEDRPIRDGEIVTACQQTCPSQAIVFGDVNDPESRVSKLKASPRNYNQRATFLYREGRYARAATDAEQALALDPNNPQALFYGGIGAANNGDTELAAVRWSQLQGLFHYWHVIHKPFAIVMYLFMIVHIVVASVTGYGWGIS